MGIIRHATHRVLPKIVVLLTALALCGCAIHLREAIPDAPTAVVVAAQLCNWAASDHLHAELQGDKWHVWDDRGYAHAYLNRFDTRGTYLCVGL
jgi:outer membrane lipopolysaccharide assembly protein LptE/RlpB